MLATAGSVYTQILKHIETFEVAMYACLEASKDVYLDDHVLHVHARKVHLHELHCETCYNELRRSV